MPDPLTKPSCQELRSALLELLDGIVDADELMFVTGLDRQTCEGILQLREGLLQTHAAPLSTLIKSHEG